MIVGAVQLFMTRGPQFVLRSPSLAYIGLLAVSCEKIFEALVKLDVSSLDVPSLLKLDVSICKLNVAGLKMDTRFEVLGRQLLCS